MQTCIFVGTKNLINKDDSSTIDKGYDLTGDTLFAATFILMHYTSFYKDKKYIEKSENINTAEHKNFDLKFYFVPENWNGNRFIYKGTLVPDFQENIDIAINVSLPEKSQPFFNDINYFPQVVEYLYPGDEGIVETLKPFLDYINEVSNFGELFSKDWRYQDAIKTIQKLHEEYERLKRDIHLNDPSHYDIYRVSRALIAQCHIFLETWIRHNELLK